MKLSFLTFHSEDAAAAAICLTRRPEISRCGALAAPIDFHPTNRLADLAADFKARFKISLAETFAAARGEGGRSAKQSPRFIDLFCGIGGFRLAFERAGRAPARRVETEAIVTQ